MKVVGISFIKNAILFDYPIQEALLSILDLCDEIIVAVGDGEDDTRNLVAAIHPTKIKIIDSVWNKNLKTGGVVLADETNKALKAVPNDADWIVYIQGDEVLHEDGIAELQQAMKDHLHNPKVDGLLLKYHHFYGSYDYIGTSSTWYRNEIRVIKNHRNIYSYKDAQGFRKNNNQKLNVKATNAYMHHYGWVKPPETMMAKAKNAGRFWGGDKFTPAYEATIFEGSFDYSQIDALAKFEGTHPKVMQPRIANKNWHFEKDISTNRLKFKDRLKNILESITGKRFFDYKNYKIV